MSMDERKFRELMDACRAGSDDLNLPELEEVAQAVEQDARVRAALARSQRVDSEIRTAMQRVAVPDGLATRILDRIAADGPPMAFVGRRAFDDRRDRFPLAAAAIARRAPEHGVWRGWRRPWHWPRPSCWRLFCCGTMGLRNPT